MQDWI